MVKVHRALAGSSVRLPNGAVLAITGKPPPGPWLGMHFSLLVLAAKQHQPSSRRFPGLRVLHVPLPDHRRALTPAERTAVLRASRVVARELAAGRSVMVTCEIGLNRSAVITSMALVRLGMPREKVVRLVRRMRWGALNNPRFARMVREEKLTRVA